MDVKKLVKRYLEIPLWKICLVVAVVFVAAAIISSIAGNGNSGSPATAPAAKNSQQETQKAEPKKAAPKEQTASVKVIPGIAAADVKLNLQKWQIKFDGPKPVPGTKEYLDRGEGTDPDTGVGLRCVIREADPMHVISVEFVADGSGVAGTLPDELYQSLAEGFLGYCATLPYDGAEQQKAMGWVQSNIGSVSQGQPLSTVIGSVKYELAGGNYMKILTMSVE